MNMTQRGFRDVLGRFATGVTIVTAKDQGEYYGLTVSSFTSVSLSPPLVLICIGREAKTLVHILNAKSFAVNILSNSQQTLSERFSRPAEKHRFHGLSTFEGDTGAPIIRGAVAYCEARVIRLSDGGDHLIILGEVLRTGLIDGDAPPILHFRGGYHTLKG